MTLDGVALRGADSEPSLHGVGLRRSTRRERVSLRRRVVSGVGKEPLDSVSKLGESSAGDVGDHGMSRRVIWSLGGVFFGRLVSVIGIGRQLGVVSMNEL
eukprot:TRINITY_DN44579_c0_g1_i1.p3 TRINITY_DN44579_c0_g1~~TRINITY_DN44579_c0_g1_i1.p3  ORF type:complete len:100 (-),score=23.74 TRINITY_DN44579_c0_g1_i1:41-340(-)